MQTGISAIQSEEEAYETPRENPMFSGVNESHTIHEARSTIVTTDPINNNTVRQPSPLARATAVHMQLTTELTDQVTGLSRLTEALAKDVLQKNGFKHDVAFFLQKVPICSGEDPRQLLAFLEEAQAIFDLQIISQPVLMSAMLARLQGNFQAWWARAIAAPITWDQLKSQILQQFITPLTMTQLIDETIRRFQKPEEDVVSFIDDIQRKASILKIQMTDHELVLQVWSHANLATLNKLKYFAPPNSLQELRQIAIRFRDAESLLQAAERREKQNQPSSQNVQCSYCNSTSHVWKNCWRRQSEAGKAGNRGAVPKN